MIIVERSNGSVIFLNEKEYVNIAYDKENRELSAIPTQPTGPMRESITFDDVTCVTYTNEAYPEKRDFRADGTPDQTAGTQTEHPEGVPAWYDDATYYPLLDQNIGNVGLSNRTVILLEKGGVHTVRDLCYLNKAELLKFRNLGRKTLNECDDFLEAKGLGFGTDIEQIERYHQILMRANTPNIEH